MPSTAVGPTNTDAEQAWLTSSVPIPAVLSARTQAAERAMVQAAGCTRTGAIPGRAEVPTTYGPETKSTRLSMVLQKCEPSITQEME